MNKKNTILIVFDELTNYNNLPNDFVKTLKGYNLFKKKCVEFTNIQTSRQQCAPSRSTIITGTYNTGLQDNVEFNYQYEYIPNLSYEVETIGKIYKKNKYDITSYYGKQHLDSKLSTGLYQSPTFNTETNSAMNIYGYDNFNVFGDTYYSPKHGLLSDNQIISYILPPNSSNYDYIENGIKYSGIVPFIKARLKDKLTFYIECHISNPHDTNHYIQNYSEIPGSTMNQFPTPFYFDQINEYNLPNVYEINQKNKYAVPQHPNLLNNYFETNYSAYKNNPYYLPFLTSFELDYATNPKINSINPLFAGTYYGLRSNMTIAKSQDDIANWKNLINNYYGLILEADSYLEKLYYFFEENKIFETSNIIIIADHGDQMSAHGLKQKQMPFKESSNVPCLIYSPNLSKKIIGKSIDLYGSLVDILPTQLVLNNLETVCEFDGKSLLSWNDGENGLELDINICEHRHYIPLNIVNSTMYIPNYFFYLQWYYDSVQSDQQIQLTSNPKNYFEYQSSFTSIIVNVDGTTYKFGRYYSILSIIKYFLLFNKDQNKFCKNKLIKYIISVKPLSVKSLIIYFKNAFTDIFAFEEGLDIIFNDFGDSNIYILYYYYAFIANTLNTNNNFINLIPGCFSSWNENSKLNIFTYLLYDIDNDPNECYNLLDPKNIDWVNIKLKNQLNDLLNFALSEKNCTKFITIIAENTILSLANLIYLVGGFLTKKFLDNKSFDLLGFVGGENIIDGSLTNKFLSGLIKLQFDYLNKINKFPIFSANLFDNINNIYYVGQITYIKFIHENLYFFKNFIFSEGLPNFQKLQYVPLNNNILPYVIVYKIFCDDKNI